VPSLAQDEEFRDLDFAVIVAAKVVTQALNDLEVRVVQDADTQVELQIIRNDAYDFLTRRLWDPDCLWLSLLEHCLVKETVLQAVASRWAGSNA